MPQKNKENLAERQPVVVVMGHVDHGKTSLLDYIRKANVAGREAGGITQAIGAYEIEHPNSALSPDGSSDPKAPIRMKRITFIDTPGHEAFTKMRSRGAQTADLAILVVAAEEGVKPQTKEAIHILEETKTPFVVAITKVDKPAADIDRVKNDLLSNGVYLEGYGGSTSFQAVSSKSGEGVHELLDLITLAADLEELRYDPKASAEGFVLETRTNKNRGMEATVIVKDGILRRGDEFATPSAKGKVKILEDFKGSAVEEVAAGAPALIVGLESLPQVGETFVTGESAAFLNSERVANAVAVASPSDPKEGALNIVLKSSDAGSLEALSQILHAMSAEQPLKILSEGVGEVGEGDVKLASSGEALIIAFKSKTDKAAKNTAQQQGVEIIASDIIYDLIIAIETKLKEMKTAGPTGELEILAVFNSAKLDKQVVGGKVVSGNFKKTAFQIKRSASAQATADKVEAIVGQGRVVNLQQNKQDTNSVPEGTECGLLVSASIAIEKGDHLLIFAE
jgi:translation initiation factor IF-2